MSKVFKTLVCGGRKYGWTELPTRTEVMNREEVKFLVDTLNELKRSVRFLGMELVIIQGEANGADAWAKKWAQENSIPTEDYKPDWDTHGKKAGFIRNSEMLKQGKPDLVIAFKGGRGTDMMCDIATKAGVHVKKTY